MRYLKYLALLAALVVMPAAHSQTRVAIGVQIGPSYGFYNVPPPCPYGYYPDYPFGCAPYGYWGPEWFVDGVFIGAGPWYRFYYVHPALYRRWYGPGCASFPRGVRFRHFDDDDWRFRHFDHDRWSRRFDDDDHHFRRVEGDRAFRDRDRFWREDRGFRGERGFREHDREFSRRGHEFHDWGERHRDREHGEHGRGGD
jgi:hypothetical protein